MENKKKSSEIVESTQRIRFIQEAIEANCTLREKLLITLDVYLETLRNIINQAREFGLICVEIYPGLFEVGRNPEGFNCGEDEC